MYAHIDPSLPTSLRRGADASLTTSS
jgi:hypothetical protein